MKKVIITAFIIVLAFASRIGSVVTTYDNTMEVERFGRIDAYTFDGMTEVEENAVLVFVTFSGEPLVIK